MNFFNNVFRYRNKLKTKLFLAFFIITTSPYSYPQSNIESILKKTTVKTFITNCRSLVEEIRSDSRSRISVIGASIEQIYDIEQIYMDGEKVDCKGIALRSNSQRQAILYGSYIDENGDRIIYY